MLSFVRCNMFEFSATNSTGVNAGANMQSWRLYIRITIRVIQMTQCFKNTHNHQNLTAKAQKNKKKTWYHTACSLQWTGWQSK